MAGGGSLCHWKPQLCSVVWEGKRNHRYYTELIREPLRRPLWKLLAPATRSGIQVHIWYLKVSFFRKEMPWGWHPAACWGLGIYRHWLCKCMFCTPHWWSIVCRLGSKLHPLLCLLGTNSLPSEVRSSFFHKLCSSLPFLFFLLDPQLNGGGGEVGK